MGSGSFGGWHVSWYLFTMASHSEKTEDGSFTGFTPLRAFSALDITRSEKLLDLGGLDHAKVKGGKRDQTRYSVIQRSARSCFPDIAWNRLQYHRSTIAQARSSKDSTLFKDRMRLYKSKNTIIMTWWICV